MLPGRDSSTIATQTRTVSVIYFALVIYPLCKSAQSRPSTYYYIDLDVRFVGILISHLDQPLTVLPPRTPCRGSRKGIRLINPLLSQRDACVACGKRISAALSSAQLRMTSVT
jgi:hypothetical protein